MASKRYSILVGIQLGLIILLALFAGHFFANNHDYQLSIFFLILLAIISASLLYTIHRVMRDTSYFFEALQNEDGSLHFPSETGSKGLNILHKNLNLLGKLVEEIRLKSAIREKYYQALIQHSATGLIAMNEKNEVEIINEKAAEYAGIPAQSHPDMIKSKNTELCNLLIAIHPGETLAYRAQRNNTLIQLSLRAKEIKIGDEHHKLISLQDIRQELNEKELESWQKLIRVLTHEIMNSIAPITSLTASLKKYFRSSEGIISPSDISSGIIENTIQGLDTIEERGSGLLKFVDSYRRLYKIPAPVFKEINIEDWLGKIKMLLSEKFAERDIHLEIAKPDPQNFSADETLMSHVLINIVNNAVDALNEKPNDRKIKIRVEKSTDARIVINILNNGPMIPADLLETIFIPFFTTKENGSGIGLSLSRQIIHLHGGYMDVSSNEEVTSFQIVI